MVTRPYHSDEDHPLRRYSSRGNSTWHISHDHFASSDSVNRRSSAREFQLSSQESRGDHDSDGESINQQPRRRIAVAVCFTKLIKSEESSTDKMMCSADVVASERSDVVVTLETGPAAQTVSKQGILNVNSLEYAIFLFLENSLLMFK